MKHKILMQIMRAVGFKNYISTLHSLISKQISNSFVNEPSIKKELQIMQQMALIITIKHYFRQ